MYILIHNLNVHQTFSSFQINLQKSFQTSTIQTKSIPPVQKEYSIGKLIWCF